MLGTTNAGGLHTSNTQRRLIWDQKPGEDLTGRDGVMYNRIPTQSANEQDGDQGKAIQATDLGVDTGGRE
jgi:hypothetical protein